MPRISEGQVAIGALIAFAAWLFVGLPWLLSPIERIEYREAPQATAQSPQAQPNGSAQAPFFVQVIPAGKSTQERTEEAQDREEKKSSDRWLVRWTLALFLATVGLIVATGALGYFAYATIRETRRIGVAQVRAYVSIKEVRVDFHSEYIHPIISFIATNSGQSPARNFISNITLQYVGNPVDRQITFKRDWLNQVGISIPAGTDAPRERFHIPNMSIKLHVEGQQAIATHCVVRALIRFRYTDVFNNEWLEEAYFAGLATKNFDVQMIAGEAPVFWHGGELFAVTKTSDWDTVSEGQDD